MINNMKEVLTTIFNAIGWAYWVEIETAKPSCTYYFGPFLLLKDAELAQVGYVEDLTKEDAAGIMVEIKRCKPTELTVIKEQEENLGLKFAVGIQT